MGLKTPRRTSLCITLRDDEVVQIGPDVEVQARRDGSKIRVRVTAPETVRILRRELKDRKQEGILVYCPHCGRDLECGFCDHCQKGYS